MPRKAATQARNRLAAGAEASYSVDDSEDEQGFDTFDSETEAHAGPAVKKKTRRSSVRTTRKGKLSGLLRLPAELITTICQHLDLATLYHVSRLNKYLWRLLRQTTSLEYLWERARVESGLPELTAAGMNVFQYANLLFGCCQLELHRDASDARFLAVTRSRWRSDYLYEYDRLSREEACKLGIAPKPRWVDFQKFPTIQAIIGVSDVQKVYDESNPTIRDRIDGIVKDLGAAVDQVGAQLRDLLRQTIQESQPRTPALQDILESDTDTPTQQSSPSTSADGLLDLAIAVFECRSKYCGFVDTFPRILSHICRLTEHVPSQNAYAPSEKAVLNVLTLLKVKSLPCDTKSAKLDKLGSTGTCLDHPRARVACTWKELLKHIASYDCSAQNVIQESLEAAKDRVLALHLTHSTC